MTFLYCDITAWPDMFLAGFFLALGAGCAVLMVLMLEAVIDGLIPRKPKEAVE